MAFPARFSLVLFSLCLSQASVSVPLGRRWPEGLVPGGREPPRRQGLAAVSFRHFVHFVGLLVENLQALLAFTTASKPILLGFESCDPSLSSSSRPCCRPSGTNTTLMEPPVNLNADQRGFSAATSQHGLLDYLHHTYTR